MEGYFVAGWGEVFLKVEENCEYTDDEGGEEVGVGVEETDEELG
jgi:hypothetical protein